MEVEPKEEETVIEEEVEEESEEAHQADPAPTGFAMVDAQSSRWPRQRRQWSSMPFLTPEEEPEVRPLPMTMTTATPTSISSTYVTRSMSSVDGSW